MGEVWLAQQAAPMQRQVAIKVVKAGMDSARVIARFEAERQALAMMDHPAIAKVFDAGTTPEGRPYFAMEYVRGEAITSYCDRQRLSVRDRLELFIQLCEGVQHAHQKGIIHRDLKPSNVLVGFVDDHPVPRIIDFGIAKAVAQPLTGHSLFTEFGTFIGTPEYMSPEQAEMSPLDVDTRSDVYSLGILLYELLVGALPFDRDALRHAGLDAIRRTIRETDAPRPSTRVTRVGADSETIAACRQTHSVKLARMLRGDLDWITVKALEKERSRRYATANALAMDIRRHLGNEPVLAGPPSAVYRTRKFVRRHRLGVGAGATLIVLLATFAVIMTIQARRIARERDRANHEARIATQVTDFLVGLFTLSDPSRARGNTLTARELLDTGARQLERGLRDEPQVQARLFQTVGSVYTSLGFYAEAEPLLDRALETQRRLLGDNALETLTTESALADVYWYRGKYRESESLYRNVVAGRTRVLGPNHRGTLRARFDLASALLQQKRWREFEGLAQDTMARQRTVLGAEDVDTLSSLNNLQAFYFQQKRFAEAEPLAREVYEIRRRTLGDEHPDTLMAIHNFASIKVALGSFDEAESLLKVAIERKRRVLGAEHPQTASSIRELGRLYVKERRYAEAEPLYLAAYQALIERLGKQHDRTREVMSLIAEMYEAAGDASKAASWRARIDEARHD